MNDNFISEEDFEDFPSPVKSDPVAINNKHAYKKVVVPSHIKEPSPSEMVSSKDIVGEASDNNIISDTSGSSRVSTVRNLDKINNLVQKEIALGRVGVTREKAYRVIAQALDARRWADVIDKQGNVKQEWVDDLDKQRWGAEMAIKMFGDMIERKEIEHDIGDRTLDRLRSLSVAELKSRAADILLGKRTPIIEAEVTR